MDEDDDLIEIITLNEIEKWNKIIDEFDSADSYYSSNYVIPFKDNGEGEPVLLYYNDGNLQMINVVIKRDLSLIESFNGKMPASTYFDFITPYGYGGMIVKGENESIGKMLKEYEIWCKNNNIISEFVRFHPLHAINKKIRDYYSFETLGPTVTVDIKNEKEVWENYTSNNRNAIRKAKKNGVSITYSNEQKDYKEFQKIYLQTMESLNSKKYYMFSDVFFDSFYKHMKEKMLVFNALYNDKVIASSIILMDKGVMHYHLSGSKREFRNLNATSLLLDEVIQYGFSKGVKRFHLGGGLGSKEDSLYKFKRNFNPKSITNFHIGKKIINKEKYEELSSSVEVKTDDYFPKYRGES